MDKVNAILEPKNKNGDEVEISMDFTPKEARTFNGIAVISYGNDFQYETIVNLAGVGQHLKIILKIFFKSFK